MTHIKIRKIDITPNKITGLISDKKLWQGTRELFCHIKLQNPQHKVFTVNLDQPVITTSLKDIEMIKRQISNLVNNVLLTTLDIDIKTKLHKEKHQNMWKEVRKRSYLYIHVLIYPNNMEKLHNWENDNALLGEKRTIKKKNFG